MATVILVRHGRSTANVAGILTGRAAGVDLDAVGRSQAARAAERLAAVPLVAVVSSPLARCRQTARIIAEHQAAPCGRSSSRASSSATTGSGRGGPCGSSPRSRCGRSCRPSRPRPCSRAASRWPPCRPGRWRRSGGTTRRWRRSTAPARCGWRSRTATSSSPSSPTRWACTSTSSSASPSTPGRSRSSGTGPTRPEVVATNTDSGDLSWLRAAGPVGDAQVGGGAGPAAVADVRS